MVNLIKYFIQGYSLSIKNLDIYLISLVFSIILIINSLIVGKIPSSMALLSVAVSFVIVFLSCGYSFSIPLFFHHLQQGNKLNTKYIVGVTLRNTKRLLIPLLVVVLGLIGLIILFGLIIIISGQNPDGIRIFVESLSSARSLSYFILITLMGVVLSFLNFTPIFFSIENLGLFTATKKSILFAFRNLKFTLMILIITLFLNFLTFLMDPLLVDENNAIFSIVQSSVFGFVYLVILIGSLLYYQDHKSSAS